MEEPLFPDKSRTPTDADLTKVLGRAKRHWDTLTSHALKQVPEATTEWKYYTKSSGWVFVVRGKRRNLVYMRPFEKCFTTSFVFGEKAVKAAEAADLPDHVVKMIRKAPKYPEGRAVRLEVKTAADVEVVSKLIRIRVEN